MQLFHNQLQNNKFSLIMSIPKNDPSMVKAAFDNGADAVKMHINVNHRASKNHFGSFAEERENIQKILEIADHRPMGIVIGGDPQSADNDLVNIIDAGFSFCSLYAHHTPVSVLQQTAISKMISCDYSYTMEDIRLFERIGADILEASVVHPEEYGTRLTAREIITYTKLANNCNLPIVVPTQKAIRPNEVKAVYETGVKAIMIGAIVTGSETDSVAKAVADFKNAIDRL